MVVKHSTLCSISGVESADDLAMTVDDIMKENVGEDPASPTIWSRRSRWDRKVHALDVPQTVQDPSAVNIGIFLIEQKTIKDNHLVLTVTSPSKRS